MYNYNILLSPLATFIKGSLPNSFQSTVSSSESTLISTASTYQTPNDTRDQGMKKVLTFT